MFKRCSSLAYLNIEYFDASLVRDCASMFENWFKLTSVDLS